MLGGVDVDEVTFRFAFSGFIMDWAAKKMIHLYPRYWKSNCVCMYDFARKDSVDYSFANFRHDAKWRTTNVTHEAYLLEPGPKSPFRHVPGFRIERDLPDGMHSKYHRGWCSFMVASCLAELSRAGDFGGDSEHKAVKNASGMFRSWLHRNKTINDTKHKFKAFSLKNMHMQTIDSEPYVSDRFKCGHTRLMCYWLADYLAEKYACGKHVTWYQSVRRRMFQALVTYEKICRAGDTILNEGHRIHAEKCLSTALLHYQWLHQRAVLDRKPYYAMKPKAHVMEHVRMSLEESRENPHCWEVWNNESFMGIFALATKIAHSGGIMHAGLKRYVMFATNQWSIMRDAVSGEKGEDLTPEYFVARRKRKASASFWVTKQKRKR